MSTTRNILKSIFASVAIFLAAAVSSCDSVIYQDEGDCDVFYAVRLRWDYNMLFADAFRGNVSSVTLFGFDDKSGTLAWQISEAGNRLSEENFQIPLDGIEPGNYKVVAWCGLENDGLRPESFSVPVLTKGVSTLSDLTCMMQREIRDDKTHHSSTDLYPLFHGMISDVKILDRLDPEAEPGTHIYTINLKKDTNHVRIILQHLSGEDVDADGFSYTVEESNGLMGHDNELLDDNVITYHEWQKTSGLAGIGFEDYPEAGSDTRAIPMPVRPCSETRAIAEVKVAIADITMARLMADRRSILTIRNEKGEIVARVPLTDYALLIKDCYHRNMTDQEYLDRQDEYTLTFFLDSDKTWGGVRVVINSWRVELQNIDFN